MYDIIQSVQKIDIYPNKNEINVYNYFNNIDV